MTLRPNRSRAAALVLAAILAPTAHAIPQLVPRLPDVKALLPEAGALRGMWKGTATESTDDFGEVTFPIELRFEGEPNALRLRVTGTAKITVEGGRRLTVAIAAEYEGAQTGTDLRMRSTRIDTRVVELNQTMPSSPQQIEAKVENGVLSGRVGNADEGWTSFTAKPAATDSADDRAEKPAFAGAWRGTGREPGPDGRELSYSVTVRLQEGRDGLVAEVSADLRYPIDGGGTTPVEYRATFRGAAENGELQMRSESVRVRLVEMNRTEQGPQQTLTGRIEDGVLRVEVGGEGQSNSRLELRRSEEGGERRDRTEETREEIREESEEARPPVRRSGGGGGNAPYATLVLEPHEVRDEGMGGIVSHRLMVPRGWRFEGGVRWSAHPDNYVNFIGALRGPGQETLTFDANRTLTHSSAPAVPGYQPPRLGSDQADGSIFRPPPQSLGEVAIDVVLPRLRPGASDFQLVDAARLPDVEAGVRKLHGETMAMIEQSIAQSRNTGGAVQSDSHLFLVAERARVRYREDGVEWEEEVRSTQLGMRGVIRSEFMTVESSGWSIFDVRCARAPAGRLDACLPTLISLAGTLRETPRWSAALAEIRLSIMRARTRGMQIALEEQRRRGAERARTMSEISDMQMQSWRERQDSMDRVHKATIDSIVGRHDFRATDGTTYAVSNQFDRAFVDNSGRVILTNDVQYRPGADQAVNQVEWQEMQRVDPFKR